MMMIKRIFKLSTHCGVFVSFFSSLLIYIRFILLFFFARFVDWAIKKRVVYLGVFFSQTERTKYVFFPL